MDPKQSKTLQKDIKSFLTKRQKISLADKRTKTISYLAAFPVWYLIYLQLFVLYQEIKTQGFTTASIVPSINLFSIFFVALILMVNYSNMPKEKEKVDKWLWKKGQRRAILLLLIFLLQALAQLFDGSIFGVHKYYVSVSYLAFAVFFGSVLTIVLHPKLFFSKTINSIGMISFFLFIGYMPIRLIILMGIELNNFIFLWSLPAIFLLIIGFKSIPISVVQIAAIQIIEPDRLFSHLRSEHQIIQDQYEALQIRSKLEKEISLGIKTELIKLYAKEYNEKNKNFWLIGLAASLSVFILSSVGEAFFQDILYGNFIRPALCNIFSVLCS